MSIQQCDHYHLAGLHLAVLSLPCACCGNEEVIWW
jgi:hypothetical protein